MRVGRKIDLYSLVEFCTNNLANGTYKVLEKLKKDPNIDTIEYNCLGYCTRCRGKLFAVVEGKVVDASTEDELLSKIYEKID
ncbi:MAG: hypothetical protein K0S51_2437 [Bacillales bacterium]|nr:hypothetical protein [Bacillales bacterium]